MHFIIVSKWEDSFVTNILENAFRCFKFLAQCLRIHLKCNLTQNVGLLSANQSNFVSEDAVVHLELDCSMVLPPK